MAARGNQIRKPYKILSNSRLSRKDGRQGERLTDCWDRAPPCPAPALQAILILDIHISAHDHIGIHGSKQIWKEGEGEGQEREGEEMGWKGRGGEGSKRGKRKRKKRKWQVHI